MDIQLPSCPARGEWRRLNAHETSLAHELDTLCHQCRFDGLIEGFTREEGLVIDYGRLEPERSCTFDARRIGTVRNHQHDLCRIVRRTRCLGQRYHVRAAARDEDADAPLAHDRNPSLPET